MSLAAIVAFCKANQVTLLSLWVAFEQYLAANPKIQANSTLQLVLRVANTVLSSATKNDSK
jgi:hypothetical protein